MSLFDKTFTLSVTKEGDAVLLTGKVPSDNEVAEGKIKFTCDYFGEYKDALGAIKELCRAFVEANKEQEAKTKSPAHALRGRLGGMKKK